MPNITQSPSTFRNQLQPDDMLYVGAAGVPPTDHWTELQYINPLRAIYPGGYDFVTNIDPDTLTLAQRDQNRAALDQMVTDALALRTSLTGYTDTYNNSVRIALYLPPAVQIAFTAPWTVPALIDVYSGGTVLRPYMNGSTVGITLGDDTNPNTGLFVDFSAVVWIGAGNTGRWNLHDDNVLVRVKGVSNGSVNFRGMEAGFIALQLRPAPGKLIFDTDFYLPNISTSIVALDLRGNTSVAWINSNRFHGGGAQRTSAGNLDAPTFGIRLSSEPGGYNGQNCNRFLNQEFQVSNDAPGKLWATSTVYAANTWVAYQNTATGYFNAYFTSLGGTSGATPPTHLAGSVSDGAVTWTYFSPWARSPVLFASAGGQCQFLGARWETGRGPFAVGHPAGVGGGNFDFEVYEKVSVTAQTSSPWDIDPRGQAPTDANVVVSAIRVFSKETNMETFRWPNPKHTAVRSSAGIYVPGYNHFPLYGFENPTSAALINPATDTDDDYIGFDGVYTSARHIFFLDLTEGALMFQLNRDWSGRFNLMGVKSDFTRFVISGAPTVPIIAENSAVSADYYSEPSDGSGIRRFACDPALILYCLCSHSEGAVQSASAFRGQDLTVLRHKADLGRVALQPYVAWQTSPLIMKPADPWTRYSQGTPIEAFLVKGEVIRELVPVVGSPTGWVVTSTGALAQAWVTSTAVKTNQLKLSDTNRIYKANIDGTTGSTAPTGTGTGINDGGVTWDYVCQLATITALPNL